VGVIDTDMPSPGIHTLFGINDEHMGKALNDFLWGRCDIEQVAYNVSASLGQIIILRLDHQDFQGTAVTIDVARKLNVPDMVLVVNKVPFSYYDFVGELRPPPLTSLDRQEKSGNQGTQRTAD
jgi:MinD-like ATPase involved in chromosome partitioning or flagellar assembly